MKDIGNTVRVKRKIENMIWPTTYYYIIYGSAIDPIEDFSLYSDLSQILLRIYHLTNGNLGSYVAY